MVSVLILLVFTVAILLAVSGSRPSSQRVELAAVPTLTPEPIVPTRTVEATVAAASETPALLPPETTATATSTPADATPGMPGTDLAEVDPPARELQRFGVTGGSLDAIAAFERGLPFGMLLNWDVVVEPLSADYEFWQMIRVGEDGIRQTSWEEIAQAADMNPGSFWLVGNEPDVPWQDNVTPQRYAEIYHDVYTFIKQRDPEAQIVIGGVAQPTPLRREYLEIVLDTYEARYGEPMPIDVWNVHAFTLREERGSWGVDIPPGMAVDTGELYEIADHANPEIMRQNLRDFRAWMAERGYGDKPLVVSEFGILMPEDYGFPPEAVARFMVEAFDWFLTATDATGYAPDGGRLVQRWFWYSLIDRYFYPTGDLYDVEGGRLTYLGEQWRAYVEGRANIQPAS